MVERVDVAGPGEPVKAGRLVVRDVRDVRPVGDSVLDAALSRIVAAGPKKPENVLPSLKKGLRPALYTRLSQGGILRCEEGRVLGIFPSLRWPAADCAYERQVRACLSEVLVVGRAPTEREAGVIALLHAVDQVPKVLGTAEVSARELRRRAKIAVSSGLADTAVLKAVQAKNTAVMTALLVSTTVATSSS